MAFCKWPDPFPMEFTAQMGRQTFIKYNGKCKAPLFRREIKEKYIIIRKAYTRADLIEDGLGGLDWLPSRKGQLSCNLHNEQRFVRWRRKEERRNIMERGNTPWTKVLKGTQVGKS